MVAIMSPSQITTGKQEEILCSGMMMDAHSVRTFVKAAFANFVPCFTTLPGLFDFKSLETNLCTKEPSLVPALC